MSVMNLLIVGAGKGSWEMRGQQLGAALGARVTSQPNVHDWRWADVAILVKKYGPVYAKAAQTYGVPIVWDALDFWSQPRDNHVDAKRATALLQEQIALIRPALVIGATEVMAEDAGGVYLPHHSRLGLMPTSARETCTVIGYDGNGAYLERWAPALQAICRKRRWSFVINPPDLAAVDIMVALRGGPWDGWMCREWKSGVKLVNAICAGRPVITQWSAALRELQPEGSIVNGVAHLDAAIDRWVDYSERQRVVDVARRRAPEFTVKAMAKRYRDILVSKVAPCTTA